MPAARLADPALPYAEELVADWIAASRISRPAANPAPRWLGGLADLLALAADRNRLPEADRLLRELYGPEAVQSAHRAWTGQLIAATGESRPSATPVEDDVWGLLRRLRPARAAGRGVG